MAQQVERYDGLIHNSIYKVAVAAAVQHSKSPDQLIVDNDRTEHGSRVLIEQAGLEAMGNVDIGHLARGNGCKQSVCCS